MQEVDRRSYEQAIQRIGELHGNMGVLSRLDALLRDEQSDLDEVQRLMQSDGAIAGAIVRLSNSALYTVGPEKRVDVDSALRAVGFDQALRLVSLALSQQVFMRDLTAYGISADAYWRYSYFSAVFMEARAPSVDADPGEAYLLGLLHSIGRVVVDELLHAEQVEIFWDRLLTPAQWERAMIGFTSEVAGSLLLEDWGFPQSISQRVAQQSNRELVVRDPLLTLLHYTRQVAAHVEDERRLAELAAPSGHLYLKLAGAATSEETLEAIRGARAKMEEVYAQMREARP